MILIILWLFDCFDRTKFFQLYTSNKKFIDKAGLKQSGRQYRKVIGSMLNRNLVKIQAMAPKVRTFLVLYSWNESDHSGMKNWSSSPASMPSISNSVSNTGSIMPTPRKGKTCKDKCSLLLLWTLELICGCQMVGSLIVVKVKELRQLLLSIHDS